MINDRQENWVGLQGKRLVLIGISEWENPELKEVAHSLRMECFSIPGIEEALTLLDRGFSFDVGLVRLKETPAPLAAKLGELRAHRGLAKTPLILLDEGLLEGSHPEGFARLEFPSPPSDLRDLLIAFFCGRSAVPSEKVETELAAPPLHVLLAEDNPVNRKVGLRILESLGFLADAVKDGTEVLSALEEKAYDLVFLDIHMPLMGGLETMTEIRKRLPAERLPRVFALTATAGEEERRCCMDVGMAGLLEKPLQIQEIQAILTENPCGHVDSPTDETGQVSADGESQVSRHIATLRENLGADTVKELIEIFLRSASSQVQNLESAVRTASFDTMIYAAHQLKGSCAQIGAENMVDMCAQLKKLGEEGDVEGVSALYAQMRQELSTLKERLHHLSG